MISTIDAHGTITMLYTETIAIDAIGLVSIRRASCVEPAANGQWTADLSPVGGPMLGPFDTRSAALAAEVAYIEDHVL